MVLHLVSRAEDIRASLARLDRWLARRRIGFGLRQSVQQVLAEILNNIAEHAYGGRLDGPITVQLTVQPRRITCIVRDNGRPMPGGALPAGDPPTINVSPDQLPEGGFGWLIIRRLSDEVTYARDGNRNVVCLTLSADRPEQTPSWAARGHDDIA